MSLQSSEDTLKLYTTKKEFFIGKRVFTDRGRYVSNRVHVTFQIEMRKKRSANGYYYWGIYVNVNAPVPLECDVSFNLDSEQNKVHECCDGIIDQGSDEIGIDEFIHHGYFMLKSSGFFFKKEAKITVKLTFSCTSKADEELYEPIKMIQSNEWCKRLQNHGKKILSLLLEMHLLKYIHKFFITLESPVIAAMLDNENFIEAQTGEMIITDFGAGIVKAVVDFCYGEDISDIMDLTDCAVDILMFADKYDMKNLKSAFEEYYCKKLTRDNVGKILEAADKANAVTLKNKCIAFIQNLPTEQRKDIANGCKSLDYELRQLFM
uniref:BTB domain-containing protein n=1 Tax=Panagrolaimus davidi TaxID=227884 RepID=A0A914PZ51_9BILA